MSNQDNMSEETSEAVENETQSNSLVIRLVLFVLVVLLLSLAFYLVFMTDPEQLSESQDSTTIQEGVPTSPNDSESDNDSETNSETSGADSESGSGVSQNDTVSGDGESNISTESENAESETAEQVLPSEMVGIELDIVRVEPTGEFVVAGRFVPNSIITMESDSKVYGETTAYDSGEWVIVSEENLSPGTYLFQFFHKLDENAEKTADPTEITVVISENIGETPLVLLHREGEATEIVQLSEAGEAIVADTGEIAGESDSPEAVQTEGSSVIASGGTAVSNEETVAKTEDEVEEFNLSIRAVESVDDKLYIAGEGKSGNEVSVFVDDMKAGTVEPNNQNRWLLETRKSLDTGTHEIVAQIQDPESEEVLSSVSVQFEKLPDSEILRPVLTVQQATGSGTAGSSRVVSVGALPNVIIRRGDNLWTISRRLYGRGIRYITIYQANKNQIDDPDLIFPGQVFLTPERDLNWAE